MQKNVAFTLYFDAVTTAGAADVATVPTVEISLDGGNYAASTNAAARIQSTHGFKVVCTQAEMNTTCTAVKVTGAGLVPRIYYLYPEATWLSSVASLIDAGISTRSSHSAADVWAVNVRSLTDKAGFALTTAYDTAKTAYSTLTAADVWGYTGRTLTSFGGLITAFWEALPFVYVAPDNAKIATIEAKTTLLVIADGKVDANAAVTVDNEAIAAAVIAGINSTTGKVLLTDTVEYPSGTPLVGATIILCTDSAGMIPGSADVTNDLGGYEFWVTPAEYWVAIQHPSFYNQLIYKDMR